MTTEEADAAYWQGRSVGILVGAAQATTDAEEERLALVARAERAEAVVARVTDEVRRASEGQRGYGFIADESQGHAPALTTARVLALLKEQA